MVRFSHLQRRLLLVVMIGALLLGGSVIQTGKALAGFGTALGPRVQSSALLNSCGTGDHIKEATIVVRK